MVTFVPDFVSAECHEWSLGAVAEMVERGEDPRDWALRQAAEAS